MRKEKVKIEIVKYSELKKKIRVSNIYGEKAKMFLRENFIL